MGLPPTNLNMAGIRDLLSLCCWIDNTNSNLLREVMDQLANCAGSEGEQEYGGSVPTEE